MSASCSSAIICAKNWQTGVTVGHSAFFGTTLETTTSVGGDIGDDCKD